MAVVPKRFVSGETLPYLGRNVRLIVAAGGRARAPAVRFDHWRFRVTVPRRLAGAERHDAIRRAVIGWYRVRAADRLAASVTRWWPRLGRGAPSPVLIPRPASTLGQLCPRRHPALQLAHRDAGAGAARIRRRPRVGPPDPSAPLAGLLGIAGPSAARCSGSGASGCGRPAERCPCDTSLLAAPLLIHGPPRQCGGTAAKGPLDTWGRPPKVPPPTRGSRLWWRKISPATPMEGADGATHQCGADCSQAARGLNAKGPAYRGRPGEAIAGNAMASAGLERSASRASLS